MDDVEKFLDVGNGVTRVIKVYDLLRFHRPGPLGGCHIYNCGVLVCHLLTCEQVDERVREPDEITVSRALLQFADGGMIDFGERVVPSSENLLSLGSSGGSEQVCDALQDITQRLRRYGVFGRELAELGDNLSERFCINSHNIMRRWRGLWVYEFIRLLAKLWLW